MLMQEEATTQGTYKGRKLLICNNYNKHSPDQLYPGVLEQFHRWIDHYISHQIYRYIPRLLYQVIYHGQSENREERDINEVRSFCNAQSKQFYEHFLK